MSIDYVGIDVSKHHLDLAMGEMEVVRVANSAEGIARLIEQVSQLRRPQVVCEATGSHTRRLSRALGDRGIAFSRSTRAGCATWRGPMVRWPRPTRLTPG